jgi:GNAT superfamily N-acetyltransferase
MNEIIICTGFVEPKRMDNIFNELEQIYPNFRSWYEEIYNKENFKMIYILFKGDVIGCAICSKEDNGYGAWINTIYLDKDYRGIGLGKVLYKMILTQIRMFKLKTCACKITCRFKNENLMTLLLNEKWIYFKENEKGDLTLLKLFEWKD